MNGAIIVPTVQQCLISQQRRRSGTKITRQGEQEEETLGGTNRLNTGTHPPKIVTQQNNKSYGIVIKEMIDSLIYNNE